MIQVLFIQGAGDGAHDQWDNKLADDLQSRLGDGYEVQYPRMPDEGDPSYAAWKPAIETELAGLKDGAVLVGHSVGGTILLHVLAETTLAFRPGGLFLIAPPFTGDDGWPRDPAMPANISTGIATWLYHGTADDTVPPAHADLYAKALPGAVIRRLQGRDHQLNNDLREVAEDILRLTQT